MNHGRHNGRKLERNRKGRRALVKTLLGSLIMVERMQTTEAKAKEAKSRIDRIINRAREAKNTNDPSKRVSALRELRRILPIIAVKKLSEDEFLQSLGDRKSGYARVVKLPPRRGDGARIALVELIREGKQGK